MAILVKHSGNAAPGAWGAFAGGQGKRHAEDASAAMARIQQSTENAKQRNFQASENRKSRKFQEKQSDTARQFSIENREDQQAYTTKSTEAAWENQRERDDLSFERAFQTADYNQQLQQENVEFGYSARQRSEFDALSQAYSEAASSGEFTPDELAEIKTQVIGKMGGIERMPQLKRKSPYPEGQGIGQTWQSEDSRFLLSRDKDGQVKKLAETNSMPTMKDIADLYGQASKALMKDDPANPGVQIAPSDDEVEKYVERAINLHQKFSDPNRRKQGGGELPDVLSEDEWGIKMTPNGLVLPEVNWGDSASGKKGPTQGPRQVRNDADYDELKSNQEFIDPEGNLRRKP
jgi:hypothetical protein